MIRHFLSFKQVVATQRMAFALLACITLFMSGIHCVSLEAAQQQEFELSNEQYIRAAFNGKYPQANRTWIKGELRDQVEKILGHRAGFIRTKYWSEGDRSVWILEEIGKDKLITVGHVLEYSDGTSSLDDVKVLAFRESRGWEVKYPFFTKQFTGASRKQNGRGLSRSIDGITGATLSVRALKKLAEIALLLDEHVRETKKLKSQPQG